MKNMKTSKANNRAMSPETYQLRRKVIDIIYEAKKLVDLPRVDVRIVDMNETRSNVLGIARLGDIIVWIPAKTIDIQSPLRLRHVVLHELLHAVFHTEHSNCPLMGAVITDTTKAQQNRLFIKHANH